MNKQRRRGPSTFAFALLVVSLIYAAGAPIAAAKDSVREIGSDQILFVDNEFVADSTAVRLKLHPARKTGEPILVAEHPWESAELNWFSVLEHGGKFRMWYECYDVAGWSTDGKAADDTSFCYAESTDGVHWTKPKLGLFEYQGSKENNILFRQIGAGDARSRVHGAAVFVDPHAPADQRFKAVSQGIFRNTGAEPYRIAGMTSPDGLVWTRYPEPICPLFADSQYSGFWDQRLRQYVIYGRVGGRGRAIGRAVSDRFDRFDPLSLTLQTDEADPADSDLYNPACMKLSAAGGVYVMCPSLYQHKPDTLDIRLAVSRDGVRWTWPDRETALIPLGKPGESDGGSLYMANGCLAVGDELWFYYSASPLKHGEATLERLTQPANRRTFRRAVIARDRLVSATAAAEAGSFTTQALKFSGARLRVNASVRPRGMLRIGLLDEQGRPISGRRPEDCRTVTGDHLQTIVEWADNPDVSSWAAKPIKLQFELKDADVFGFQFAATE
ncbi:MAG TPA: hypothetical protein VHY91_22160 [Pirellulales bacterium]|jgi:hypothetical protein|nr:hypothetical protein [Pirellulales bacterium]